MVSVLGFLLFGGAFMGNEKKGKLLITIAIVAFWTAYLNSRDTAFSNCDYSVSFIALGIFFKDC
jgi:hypothetical protein